MDSPARADHQPRHLLERCAFALGGVIVAWAAVVCPGAAVRSQVQPDRAAAFATGPADGVSRAQAPRRVAVVGDSLIATTTPEQQAELARRGYVATVSGNPGKPLTDQWIQARLGEAVGVDIVVVATTSNDNVQLAHRADTVGIAQATSEYASTLASALDTVAAPCTVVVDVREQASALYRPETARFTNATLGAVAANSNHAVVVVAWSATSATHDHTDWFVADELHFISDGERHDAGVEAYAQAIADGVDRCDAALGNPV